MIKAGLKKEFLMLSRSGRLLALVCVTAAIAVCSPLLLKLTQTFLQSGIPGMETVKEQIGETIGETPRASAGFAEAAASNTTLVLYLILLFPAMGGEDKNGSFIIPHTAGITPFGRVLPKFILHFILSGILSLAGSIAAAVISALAFPNDISIAGFLLATLFRWLFSASAISIGLALGISFKKPLSAVFVSIALVSFLPQWLEQQGALNFSPFALISFIYPVTVGKSDVSAGNIILSVLFSLLTVIASVFIAVTAQKAEVAEN